MNKTQISQLEQRRAQLIKELEQFQKQPVKAKTDIGIDKEENMSQKAEIKKTKLTSFAKPLMAENIESQNQSVSEVLNLNDKLISTLEKADSQIEALSQLNTKLAQELQATNATIQEHKNKDLELKQKQFDNRVNTLTNQWCEVFAISDAEQQEDAKKMLSTFESEDKLESISGFLNHKLSQMSDLPKPITKQSAVIKELQAPQEPVKQLEQMSAQERKQYTDGLFERMSQINPQ